MEIPNDIYALFDRSKEHLNELIEEYKISIENAVVTPRAKIITHQALSLCRHALDHAMRLYWNKKWYDRLPETKKSSFIRVYFPVAWRESDFSSKLTIYKMKDLEIHDPKVYDFLFNCQAFNNANYKWLKLLNTLAGKGKHEHLIEQKRIVHTHYTLEFAPEGKIKWRVSTTEVDPNNIAQKRKEYIGSEELPQNRGFKETVKQRSAFGIMNPEDSEDSEYDAFFYCQEIRENTIELVKEFFQLF